MDEALRARLAANTTLAGLVGREISWEARNVTGDHAIVIELVVPGREYTHGGASDLSNARVRLRCFSTSWATVRAIERAAVTEMEQRKLQGTVQFEESFVVGGGSGPVIDKAGGAKAYERRIDFSVWYKEG